MEQPEYSMLKRERFEKEYLPIYDNFGLGTSIWSPLSGGLLSGKVFFVAVTVFIYIDM